MNKAIPTTWKDRHADLGFVAMDRVLCDPQPGTATVADVTRIQDTSGRLCELVDGTLVEKAMGWQESMLAGVLLHWLSTYLDENPIGVATGADGLTLLFDGTVRGPDVAFVAWDRLPGGKIPSEPIPHLVPNFVIEVLSVSNTYSEMSRKRREYFQAGVQLLWLVDPLERAVAVYDSIVHFETCQAGEVLSGGSVLPDWTVDTGKLFAKLDQQAPDGS